VSQVAFAVDVSLGENRLFDIASSRDSCLERFVVLRQLLQAEHIKCDTVDICDPGSVDIVVSSDIRTDQKDIISVIKSNPRARLLYLPTEPEVITAFHDCQVLELLPFDKVLFWHDEFVNRVHHAVKCNIGQPVIDPGSIPVVSFEDKKFLSAISANKFIRHKNGLYEERLKAYDFFGTEKHSLDLFGIGWDQSRLTFVATSYRGSCMSKRDVLRNYKFSICFENATGYPGLITEKIFDCFTAGTVPVYYGAPDIDKYIPDGCYIDFRSFTGYEELYCYLVSMDEREYVRYLDAVKSFLESPQYYLFTSTCFAKVVSEQIDHLLSKPAEIKTVAGFKFSLFKAVCKRPVLMMKELGRCRKFLFDYLFAW